MVTVYFHDADGHCLARVPDLATDRNSACLDALRTLDADTRADVHMIFAHVHETERTSRVA